MRVKFRAALTLLLTGFLLMVTMPAAVAQPLDGIHIPGIQCSNDPVIDGPEQGKANALDPGPKHPDHGDPWKPGSNTSVYEAYGYAGLHWQDLSPGCNPLPDAATDPGGSGLGAMSNVMLSVAAIGTAITAHVDRAVYEGHWLDKLNPIRDLGVQVFGWGIFMPLAGIVMAAVGVMVMVRSHDGDVARSMTQGGWAIAVVAVILFMITWPTVLVPKITGAMDTGLASVHQIVNQKSGGDPSDSLTDSATSSLHYGVLYQTWCAGMVGRSNGPAAEKYCPRLFKHSTFSRAEVKSFHGDKDARLAAAKEKAKKYDQDVQDLKDEYPDAYQYVAGKQNTDRAMSAGMALFTFLLSAPFSLWAALLYGFAKIMLVVALIMAPLVGLLAIYHPWRGPLLRIGDQVVTQVRNALVFGVVSAVILASWVKFLAPGSDTSPFWIMLLEAMFAVAVWVQTRGFRAMGLPGTQKAREHGSSLMSKVMTGASLANAGANLYDAHQTHEARDEAAERWDAHQAYVVDTGVRSTPPPSTASAAVKGAVVGGAAALATGGASLAATAGAAARGAGKGAVAHKLAGGTGGGDGAPAVYQSSKGGHAGADESTRPTVSRPTDTPPTGPAAEPRLVEAQTDEAGDTVYPIFTSTKGADE